MVIPLIWFVLNGVGIYVEGALISKALSSDTSHGNNWWIPIETGGDGEIYKRYKRLIVPRHDEILAPNVATAQSTAQTPTAIKKKVKNSKKKGGVSGKDDPSKPNKTYPGVNKKIKKQGKMKKINPGSLRQGQSLKRLRQHMQHKKKVKEFLQKRIQEQIEQRNQNNPSVFN
ncbi:hypothetical protein JTE90_015296 [Oedothorax gibbosus]|uniref:Uncharacterized protein n=1 Tax=Oedothorax gibbosus TaxID=931172 RepID=A0AAV6VR07_9ARAC|nr:hypothetical protein JTE90_015296 [Oedothorax gibbosus]